MGLRTVACFCVVNLIVVCCDRLEAESWSVKPKPSRERRLAPELDLLQHNECHFLGICEDGNAVYKIAAEKTRTIRAMALKMDSNNSNLNPKTRRLLISYARGGSKPSAETLAKARLKLIEDYEKGSFLLVEPEQTVSASTVHALLADHAIVHATPDYIVSAVPIDRRVVVPPSVTQTNPNDPLLNLLWGMQNIHATQVWPTIHAAPKIIVAVIDTGVDYNHPDLKNNMWSRGGKIGYDFFDNDDDPRDEGNHGTHCAGTIAATGDNGIGVVGVAWKAQIMAVRFLGPDGSGLVSDAIKSIDWAIENGAHIISNSWSGPDASPELADAVSRAEQKGVLFVTAAGNTARVGNNNDVVPFFPASLPNSNVLTVAAIDSSNERPSFSHFGRTSVDIGAPGVGIVSTIMYGQYATCDGTSMAAPHVAGAAALVWSRTFSSPAQDRVQMIRVRDLICDHARPVPELKDLWGQTARARVPGGVLDLSFLADTSGSDGLPKRTAVEFRVKVDPSKLR